MTQPAARPATPTPPPNPRIQAVDFALQLAGLRQAMPPKEEVTVQELLADADAIDTFISGSRS